MVDGREARIDELSEIRLSEIRLSEIRLSAISLSEIRLSEIRPPLAAEGGIGSGMVQ